MTGSLISLFSIVIGMFGAYTAGFFFKKASFGFTGNTLIGVFGSIFLIKSFGRLGFSTKAILVHDNDYKLLLLNLLISFIGGFAAVFIIHKIYLKMNT